jgi:hypothetical protein
MTLVLLQAMSEYAGVASQTVTVSRNPLGTLVEWFSSAGVEEYVIVGVALLAVVLLFNKLLDAM